ncbi:MAG: AI-2E family transporter [Patescibacteria group bacterium]|jgi:predicted PurR-regulated permease PerM
MPKNLTKPFVLVLVLLVIVGCYLVFRPFLTEILVAAILASVFYTPFARFTKFLKGRRNLAAILMCLLLLVIIILPSMKLVSYAGQKSVSAYTATVEFFNNHSVSDVFQSEIFQSGPLRFLKLDKLNMTSAAVKEAVLNTLEKSSNWLISGASIAIKGTATFVISLVLIIITMFFFFVDGKKMLTRLMYLSPLPNRYDQEIFRKFRSVSYTIFVSTFVAAASQGIVAAIGFAVIGFPAFLAGVVVALLSLLPYVGSMIFYLPVGIYYLLIGSIWQGIFILLWGFLVIGTVDNIVRAYMIKGEAQVNPIFVLFSILGGIVLFGFWGVVLGPLIVALAVTVFHIYELEFCGSLEGRGCEEIKKEVEAEKKMANKPEKAEDTGNKKNNKK